MLVAFSRALAVAVAGAVLVVGHGSSSAQQMTWSGAYIGAHLGQARGHSDAQTAVGCPANGYFCTTTQFHSNVGHIQGNGTGTLSDSSVSWGGLAGYNWQFSNLVVGLEADVGTMRLGASRSVGPVGYPTNAAVRYTIGSSFETDWLATARARIGFSFSSFLLYATGGIAATELTVSNQMIVDPNTVPIARGSSSADERKYGRTWGGGLEWAVNRN